MKGILLAVLSTLVTSGCMTPHSVAHKHKPTPTPTLAGYWVGSNMIHTHTMLIRADGTGELCWEALGKYSTTPVTISGDKIIAMTEANFRVNADGTVSQCSYGACMHFKRTEHVAAACREWLKQ